MFWCLIQCAFRPDNSRWASVRRNSYCSENPSVRTVKHCCQGLIRGLSTNFPLVFDTQAISAKSRSMRNFVDSLRNIIQVVRTAKLYTMLGRSNGGDDIEKFSQYVVCQCGTLGNINTWNSANNFPCQAALPSARTEERKSQTPWKWTKRTCTASTQEKDSNIRSPAADRHTFSWSYFTSWQHCFVSL